MVISGAPAPRPVRHERHGHVRTDEWHWLREREDPAVRAHLEAENRRTREAMAHTGALQGRLYREVRGRIRETDASVPYRRGDHFYYVRHERGSEYPIHCRRLAAPGDPAAPRHPRDLATPEEVLLDVNRLAEGHDFLSLGAVEPSPDGRVLAFAYDTSGDRVYTLRFRDLVGGELLPDVVSRAAGDVAWANDGRTVLYGRPDPETLRAHAVDRHVLGTPSSSDGRVYEEEDKTFSLQVFRARSGRMLFIAAHQTVSSEYRWLDADRPDGEPRVVVERERGHEYRADHLGEWFWLLTNDGAENFRFVRAPVDDPRRERWEEVVPGRDDVLLEGFELFRDHVVVEERGDALVRLRVHPLSDGEERLVEFDEPAYHCWIDENHEPDAGAVRFGCASLATPPTVYDLDPATGERSLLKREPVLGGFDPADYVTERLLAPARDGARVPISLVRRRDVPRDGSAPLLLYGYGAYGYSMDPTFSSARLSLLDRGFVFALAHVRGGQELGRRWYEQGRLLNKRTTFSDFIACAEHLVAEGWARPERLYASGRSAGGLLMGVVVNERPDLFHGVVAGVPFVDVVTTMLDEALPLTTGEYDEWGDPRRRDYYEYILSYSPYDNVRAQDYPHLLVTTALHDSQVQYWEPAKWVARMRARKTDDNRLLLKTNLVAGHGGASGRYERMRELAFEYAFLLDLAGLGEEPAAMAETGDAGEAGRTG